MYEEVGGLEFWSVEERYSKSSNQISFQSIGTEIQD